MTDIKNVRTYGDWWGALERSSGRQTVERVWDRWSGYRSTYDWDLRKGVPSAETEARAQRLLYAAKMVQTFVDALAGSAEQWSVGISSNAHTASTDLEHATTTLPASVILDPALSETEAGALMMAYVGHEIGHIRYDRDLARLVAEAIKDKDDGTIALWRRLSNVLRESRVERGFASDFPGYGGLFGPMLRYVSRETPDNSKPPTTGINFAVAATRYPFRFDWSDTKDAAERDWWRGWINRWADRDDIGGHLEGLEEGAKRLAASSRPAMDSNQTGELMRQQSAQAAAEAKSMRDKAREDWYQGKIDEAEYRTRVRQAGAVKAAQTRRNGKMKASTQDATGSILPVSIEDASADRDKDREARDNAIAAAHEQYTKDNDYGAYSQAVSAANQGFNIKRAGLEEAARQANIMLGMSDDGQRSAVMSVRDVPTFLSPVEPDPAASAVFRQAFMRLRGGASGWIGDKRRGRLDDRALHRLASRSDDRVFEKRGASNVQPLRVFVMVDCSGSMDGPQIEDMRNTAASLADAARGIPGMHLSVFGWDTAGIVPAWESGMPIARIGALHASGGTPDASALRWASRRLQRDLRGDEHGVILMLSDGEGEGAYLLRSVVRTAREAHLSVFGIASGRVDLSKAYGEDSWSPWRGSVVETAVPMAALLVAAMRKTKHSE